MPALLGPVLLDFLPGMSPGLRTQVVVSLREANVSVVWPTLRAMEVASCAVSCSEALGRCFFRTVGIPVRGFPRTGHGVFGQSVVHAKSTEGI